MAVKLSKEMRVGAFLLAALAVVLVVVFTIGGSQKLFGDRVSYRILFESTAGLYEGDPVLLTGVEVGNVSHIGFPDKLDERKIVVEISVQRDASRRIRRDTRARIGSASIVYGKVVLLSMGSSEEPMVELGGFIPADESSTVSAIVDSTQTMIGGLSRVISKLERGQGAFSTILNEPLELRQTLANLSVASDRLARILDRVERGRGPLGAVIADSSDFHRTLRDVQSAAADLKAVASNLRHGQGAASRLINDPAYSRQTLEDLRSAARSLASVAAKIDTGQGTLGLLINDPELYLSLNDVVVGAQKSKVLRWMIQNRRKSGAQERAPESVNRKDSAPAPSPGEAVPR
jgi:phospholipid/cholesterol/gamma-HCH transport system substrate-binding protein